MKIVYDRETCIGMFQCVDEWATFEKDLDAGKAHLVGATEREDGRLEVEVPEDEAFEAEFAARVCPVDAIELYDDDGEQVV
jgi:ferredoxin